MIHHFPVETDPHTPENLKDKLLSHLHVHCDFLHLENLFPFPPKSLRKLSWHPRRWKIMSFLLWNEHHKKVSVEYETTWSKHLKRKTKQQQQNSIKNLVIILKIISFFGLKSLYEIYLRKSLLDEWKRSRRWIKLIVSDVGSLKLLGFSNSCLSLSQPDTIKKFK